MLRARVYMFAWNPSTRERSIDSCVAAGGASAAAVMVMQDDVVLTPAQAYTQQLISNVLAPKLHEMVKDIMVRCLCQCWSFLRVRDVLGVTWLLARVFCSTLLAPRPRSPPVQARTCA